jgi:hypothetical protein
VGLAASVVIRPLRHPNPHGGKWCLRRSGGGRALIGDADCRRIVLDAAGRREDLPVFFLRAGDRRIAAVEDDESRADRALVDCANELR